MKTLVINGSPNGKRGNTELFIKNFVKGASKCTTVKRLVEEDLKQLVEAIRGYDSVILALPLYIHSMPGIVMRFVECLEADAVQKPEAIGFILQCGFPESSQCDYLVKYFECLAEELSLKYLGTLVKPEAAGISVMPGFMTRKLFGRLTRFGRIYEDTGCFDKALIEQIRQPYEIKGFVFKLLKAAKKLGLMNIMWNRNLKREGVFKERFNRPFAG